MMDFDQENFDSVNAALVWSWLENLDRVLSWLYEAFWLLLLQCAVVVKPWIECEFVAKASIEHEVVAKA